MKRWLLLTLLPIAALLLAVGVLAVRHSGDAKAEAVPGDSAACPAGHTDLDSSALIASLDASPLGDIDKALLAAKCYLVGIDVIPNGCGCGDLYILRYLCYNPAKGWYYVNYWYCTGDFPGGLNHGTTTGEYSYKGGSNCSGGESDWVDPITVVFTRGTHTTVQDHACDHGSWCFSDGGTQRFWSYGCWPQDANANSASPPLTQFHMRLLTGRYWDGSYDCDARWWGYYTLATPHHEKWGLPQPGCGDSGHSVYDNEEDPPGGFIEGRNDIIKNWVTYGPHYYRGSENWGNTHAFKQSMGKGILFGCWYAWSDGWVDFISANHY